MSASIYVAVPAYRSQIYTNLAVSLIDLAAEGARASVPSTVHFMSDAAISRARNDMAAAFLASDFTHLLFVDEDIGGFRAADVFALVGSGLDVVAIPCPRRDPKGAGFVVNLLEQHQGAGEIPCVEVHGRRFVQVHDAGTGIMCIRRGVFERMVAELDASIGYVDERTWTPGLPPARRWDFFPCVADAGELEPGRRRYLSEDYLFCRRWQRLGGKVHALLGCTPTHFGPVEFGGSFDAWLGAQLKKRDVGGAA